MADEVEDEMIDDEVVEAVEDEVVDDEAVEAAEDESGDVAVAEKPAKKTAKKGKSAEEVPDDEDEDEGGDSSMHPSASELAGEDKLNYADEMRKSYLTYSLAVIKGRALPDVRDGLKPVQRRVLYAMRTLGLVSNAQHQKSAKVVGETIGNYHPHGDSAVYETMVRLAQDFRLRTTLVDGQGNFGSLEDPPAASRYTEARLTKAGDLFFVDADPAIVEFRPSFDGSNSEPTVLPSSFPNLLVNGTQGIAVGMSTRMPPHNPGEVLDMLLVLLDKPDATIAELMRKLPGPDFPSGGVISSEGLKEMYATGRGKVSSIGKLQVEQMPKNLEQVVITELPYEVNKTTLQNRIKDLYVNNKFEELTDMKDETSRHGTRLILKLKRGADTRLVEEKLRKETMFQLDYPVQMLVIVDDQPVTLNLKELGEHFIGFRYEIITKRAEKRLKEVEDRLHILVALQKAIDKIDDVVKIIKSTPDSEQTKVKLKKLLSIDDVQVEAILSMPLRRLGSLERKTLQEETKKLTTEQTELKALLKSKEKKTEMIRGELLEMKKQFTTPRASVINKDIAASAAASEFGDRDLVVSLTDTWRAVAFSGSVKRSGLGVKTGKDELLTCFAFGRLSDDYLVFTDQGNAYRLHGSDLYVASSKTMGQSVLRHIRPKDADEKPVALLRMDEATENYCLVTKQGIVKKVAASELAKVHGSGVRAFNVADDDSLIYVDVASDHLFMLTRGAKILRFSLTGLRTMGRNAGGVRGITLGKEEDHVVAAASVAAKDPRLLLLLSENKKIKAVKLSEIPTKGRTGQGVAIYKVNPRIGVPVAASVIPAEGDLLVISPLGNHLSKNVSDFPLLHRANSPRNCGSGFAKLYRDGESSRFYFVAPPHDDGADTGADTASADDDADDSESSDE